MLVDLARTPISEALRRLSAERRSGDLEVRAGVVVKTVYFDHGRIVFAASNLKRDRLGEALVALGRITNEEYKRASSLMRSERRRRFGEALVDAGVLKPNEVGRSVARQVNRIVLSVFGLGEGVASFAERRCPIPLEYMVSLSLHRVLYDGIRALPRDELVLAGLGNLDQRVTLAPVPPFRFDLDSCPDGEREILEQASRWVTLRRLAWGEDGLDPARLRAAYALLASGVLTTRVDDEETPSPAAHVETGTFLLSALQRNPGPTPEQSLRDEVKQELKLSARLDRANWLKATRTTPRGDLQRALESKMERYHELREQVVHDPELLTDVEVILGRASGLLRMIKQSPGSADPEDVLPPVLREETTEPGLSRLRAAAEARMAVSDYAGAVKAFRALVDRAPDVAAYRSAFAIAMANYPPTARTAEREFLEAVRLEPANADLHYRFGLYYKTMRQRSRALAEIQTAVRLDPRHALAREELETMSPSDPALVELKRQLRERG